MGKKLMGKKNPGNAPGFLYRLTPSLLDLGFFIDHVLTRNRIVLFHFELVGHGPLVLVCSVKMAGTCRGIHSDLFTHGLFLRLSRRERVYPRAPTRYRACR